MVPLPIGDGEETGAAVIVVGSHAILLHPRAKGSGRQVIRLAETGSLAGKVSSRPSSSRAS